MRLQFRRLNETRILARNGRRWCSGHVLLYREQQRSKSPSHHCLEGTKWHEEPLPGRAGKGGCHVSLFYIFITIFFFILLYYSCFLSCFVSRGISSLYSWHFFRIMMGSMAWFFIFRFLFTSTPLIFRLWLISSFSSFHCSLLL